MNKSTVLPVQEGVTLTRGMESQSAGGRSVHSIDEQTLGQVPAHHGALGPAHGGVQGLKKWAYEALEQRFGSTPQLSTQQESKAKKSKASRSRSQRRNVAQGVGGGHRDHTDVGPSAAKGCRSTPGQVDGGSALLQRQEFHHQNHDGFRYMGSSQTMHQDIDRTSQAKQFKAQKSGVWKRDVAWVAGEEGPLDDLDNDPSPAKNDNSGKVKHPAYVGLSMTLDENLIKITEKDDSNGVGYANKFMHNLLLNGDCSQKYMKGMQNMKFDDWFLLDNLVPKVSSTDERAKSLRSHSRRSKKHMSMKQHRKCGSFDLPQEFHSFDLFKPMHEMWKDYVAKVLKETGRNQISPRLLTANLHGAMLLVVECKTTAFTGVKGIMVRETTETFGIVTEKNKFRELQNRKKTPETERGKRTTLLVSLVCVALVDFCGQKSVQLLKGDGVLRSCYSTPLNFRTATGAAMTKNRD